MAIKKYTPSIIFTLLVVGVYVVTKNPITGPFSLQITLVSLFVLIGYTIIAKRKSTPLRRKRTFLYLVTAFTLLLVASTGWFFSPFFFALYLLALLIAFIVGLPPSLAFVITLVALFSFNIGEVDLAYDFLVVLSLVSVIPISYYLRREYLRIRESEKDILVLEEDEGAKYEDKIKEVLANKVDNMAVSLRQPVNDAKQLAHSIKETKSKKRIGTYVDRIIASTDEAIRLINKFEEEATGQEVIKSPGRSKASQPHQPIELE